MIQAESPTLPNDDPVIVRVFPLSKALVITGVAAVVKVS